MVDGVADVLHSDMRCRGLVWGPIAIAGVGRRL